MRYLFLSSGILTACLAACVDEARVIDRGPLIGRDAAVSSRSLSMDDVLHGLRHYEGTHPGRTLTVAEWVRSLPEAYRSSFALMHTSRSLQQSDPEAPRVILFGDDARTVLTFNGRPTQGGYNTVEMAGFDANEHVVFRRLEFPPGDDGMGHVEVSDANPPQCMACHGPVPHFIWGEYATWPGAFGARDDALDLEQPGAPNDRPLVDEASWLARVRRSPLPRYASLLFDPHGLGDTAPYRPYVGASGSKKTEPRLEYLLAVEARPNARLGMLMLRHQVSQRYAAMANAPNFDSERYALLEALMCDHGQGDAVEPVAQRLGEDIDVAWHFEMGPMGPSQYLDGTTTFRQEMRDRLLSHGFADDAEVVARRVPASLAQRYRPIALGEAGRRMWQAIEAAGAPFVPNAAASVALCQYLRLKAEM